MRKDLKDISQFEKMFRAFVDNFMNAEAEEQEKVRLESEAGKNTIKQINHPNTNGKNTGGKEINVHIHLNE